MPHLPDDAATTRVDLISVESATEAARAVAAAAEAIAAGAAADVASEAAATAQAAVDAAVLAAANATARAKTVAASAAVAAAAAARAAARSEAPAGSPPGSKPPMVPAGAATAALAAAHAAAAAAAAAKAVAKLAMSVAESAAVAAAHVIEAADLVQAELLTQAAATAQALVAAGTEDVLTVDRPAGGADTQAGVQPEVGHLARQWSATLVDDGRALAICGELDAHTGPLLAAEFARRPSDSFDTGVFTLGLTGLSFVDVRGLRALSDIADVVSGAGRRLLFEPTSAEGAARPLRWAVALGWLPRHFLAAFDTADDVQR